MTKTKQKKKEKKKQKNKMDDTYLNKEKKKKRIRKNLVKSAYTKIDIHVFLNRKETKMCMCEKVTCVRKQSNLNLYIECIQ